MTRDLAQQFAALWESVDGPPDVFAFLEQHGGSTIADVLAVLQTDQQHRWRTEAPLSVQDYLAQLPELAGDPDARLELAASEYQARQAGDTRPDIDAFTLQFDGLADQLRQRIAEPTDSPSEAPASGDIDHWCDEFEAAWRSGDTPVLDVWLNRCPAAAQVRLLGELLPIEWWWRRERGDHPDLADYCARYLPVPNSLRNDSRATPFRKSLNGNALQKFESFTVVRR